MPPLHASNCFTDLFFRSFPGFVHAYFHSCVPGAWCFNKHPCPRGLANLKFCIFVLTSFCPFISMHSDLYVPAAANLPIAPIYNLTVSTIHALSKPLSINLFISTTAPFNHQWAYVFLRLTAFPFFPSICFPTFIFICRSINPIQGGTVSLSSYLHGYCYPFSSLTTHF